jgi:tRNA(fMet)-specific endonuclease VapC
LIVIDSDVLIEIIDRKSKKGDQALRQIVESREDIATTAISLHEVLYGLHKYGKSVTELLQLPILSYTKKDAALSSEIELETEKKG